MATSISKVKIGNLALSALGARSSIENFTEDTAEAAQINLWYDVSREQSLQDYDWNFARKRQALALSAEDAPAGIWTFRYLYPADCLAIREMENPFGVVTTSNAGILTTNSSNAVPFQVEMDSTGQLKTILTDLETASVAYTFNQETTSIFSLYFVKMLSFLLAHNIAMSLTGKTGLQDRMLDRYLRYLQNAPSADANERVDRMPREAESIRARI